MHARWWATTLPECACMARHGTPAKPHCDACARALRTGDALKGWANFATNDSAVAYSKFFGWLAEGKLYVNVHTVARGGGEMRGQLECAAPCTL